MAAVECARPYQTIFSSSNAKPRNVGRRTTNYKKIRWRAYDPGKKAPGPDEDHFVQWQPPTAVEGLEVRDTVHDLKPRKATGSKITTPDTSTVSLSPIEPLPSNGTRMDPFLALPIKSTEAVQDTMDYFITICKGLTGDKLVSSGPSGNPHLSLLLPYALKHAILFESIISVCRASILLSLGRPIWEDYAFVHHRGSTIARLNEHLKTKHATDNEALLTVSMLMTLEYLCGNYSGVTLHCKGLERMLELRGPLVDEDDPDPDSQWLKFVKLGLTAYKALGSFVTGKPPEAPRDSVAYLSETFQELQLDQPLAYPDTPFSPDMCIILSRLPLGLSELCLTSQISVQMIKLLASISAATTLIATEPVVYNLPINTYTSSPASSTSDLPTQEDRDTERKHMLMQTILSSLQRMCLTTTQPIEYHLTSGLLSLLFQLRDLGPVNLFYDPILRKFITSLPNQAKPSTPQEQNCLIWASMAVAGTLALRVVPMPDSHLVMDHALNLYPQMRSWSKLEQILHTYFLPSEEIGRHWQTVWQTAMKRREFLLRRRGTLVSYDEGGYEDAGVEDESLSTSTVTGTDATSNSSTKNPRTQTSSQTTSQILHEMSMSPDSPMYDVDSAVIRSHIQQHIAGAPRSIREMSQAMGLCPMRSQWASSK